MNSKLKQLELQADHERLLLELLASEKPLPEVLNLLAISYERTFPGLITSILLLDKTGRKLYHGAAPSLPIDYCKAVDGLEIGPKTGSCGTAAYTGKRTLVSDIATDPLWENYKSLALAHGLRACWSFPILDLTGKVLGTFAFYSRTARQILETELALMERGAYFARSAIERHHANIALKESEERYRGLVELSPDIIAVTFEGKVDFVNQAGIQFYGAESESEILGRSLLDFFHPSSHEAVLTRLNQLQFEPVIPPVELLILRKDGSMVEAESRAMSLPWKGKQAALAVIRDITERKRSEAAIRESEARYRTLATVTPVGLYRTDLLGNYTFVNDHLCNILGKSLQEILGKTGFPSIHRSDRDWVRKAWSEAMQNKMRFKAEFRIQRTDGNVIWVIGNLEPEHGTDGITTGFIGTIVDIAERKQTEILLAFQNLTLGMVAEREHLQKILNSIVQYLEKECEGGLGGILQFLPGQASPIWISAESLSENDKNESLRNGMQGFTSRPIIGANGQLMGSVVLGFPSAIEAAAIEPSAFEPSPFNFKLMDMAATLAAHAMDRARQEGINRKNIELTEENHRILDASRMKSEFMATMSHELRTPLNSIIGFSQLLIDGRVGQLNEKQAEYLSDILEGGMHLLRLITDVLDLSKIEAGKMQLNFEAIHVEQSIREVCDILMPMALSKKIQIRISVDSSFEEAMLDSQKFRQILFNLVSNAIKFSNESGEICISATAEPKSGMTLSVSDQGIGISKTDIPKLFQQFQQLASGTNREFGGSGLGLVITQKLVELHKGKVWVESQASKGSTFYATFPNSMINQTSP